MNSAYLEAGMYLIPIPLGEKGPTTPGWNLPQNCVSLKADLDKLTGKNVGLAHLHSRTCAIDFDDLKKATVFFASHGVDITKYFMSDDSVQISSGRDNHGKLIYRLPHGVDWLPTMMLSEYGVELRCANRDGTATVQDILPPSIHPGTGKPYTWIGDWRNIPELPPELLKLWRKVQSGKNDVLPKKSNGTQQIIEGGRNSYLTSLGGTLRKRGCTVETIYAALEVCNRTQCAPPLQEKDVRTIANSVSSYAQGKLPEKNFKVKPPSRAEMKWTLEDLELAHLTPRCFVENYLYADVSVLAAPGGSGKTTLMLYEAVKFILGQELWGLQIKNPGWVLLVTAEDSAETCKARTREIMQAMGLSIEQKRKVLDNFCVWDVVGSDLHLAQLQDGNVCTTDLPDDIIEAYGDMPPAIIIIDPTSSFGASEQAINDNEIGLIRAARKLVSNLGCCVRFIHHTGKQNAREKTLDQYSARGGSALSDGARMVTVLSRWESGDERTPPATLSGGDDLVILSRAKLSYCKSQPLIWIARDGFKFEHAVEIKLSDDQILRGESEQLLKFIDSQNRLGRHHSGKTLDDVYQTIGLSRNSGRRALGELKLSGKVIETPLPKSLQQGGRKSYFTVSPLKPSAHTAQQLANLAATPGEVRPNSATLAATQNPADLAAALREKNGGEVAAPFFPPDLTPRGETSARYGEVGEVAESHSKTEAKTRRVTEL